MILLLNIQCLDNLNGYDSKLSFSFRHVTVFFYIPHTCSCFDKMSESVCETVGKNWCSICRQLLDIDPNEEFSFKEEKLVLQTVVRNVFHKKPSLLAIEFLEVG